MTMRKAHIYIDGLVQGVGFRYFIKKKAEELGIKGFVRNIQGGVEVIAEGEYKAIEELIKKCWEGPPTARVDNVTVEDSPPQLLFKDFTIKPDLKQ